MTFAEENGRKPYRYERPPFGEFGRLAYVGDRLVCHLCGRDWVNLASHAALQHGLLADDYREAFGLLRGQALWSRRLCARQGDRARARQAAGTLRRFQRGAVPPLSADAIRRSGEGQRRWWALHATPERRAALAALVRSHPPARRPGSANPQARLTEAQVVDILRRWCRPLAPSQEQLAREYGVSRSAIGYIVNGETWQHVPRPADWHSPSPRLGHSLGPRPPVSEETREKLRRANAARSPETLEKIARAVRARSPETLEKIARTARAASARRVLCKNGHRLDPGNVRVEHRAGRPGSVSRVCRACQRENSRRYKSRQKERVNA